MPVSIETYLLEKLLLRPMDFWKMEFPFHLKRQSSLSVLQSVAEKVLLSHHDPEILGGPVARIHG